MKGAASKILIGLGIILIVAAILWWAIAVNALVKLPDDVEIKSLLQGETTSYVDPSTQQRLPEGSEVKETVEYENTATAAKGQFSSSKGVLDMVSITRIQGRPEQSVQAAFVLDRKSLENVADDRAYSFRYVDQAGQEHAGVPVDRQGAYYPLLPSDTSKDQTYKLWKEEIADSFELEFVNEEEKEGVTIYNFKGSYSDREASDALVQSLGLPQDVTFEQIKLALASEGIDVNNLLSQASQRLSPEDMQALNQALQGTIPVKYLWSQDFEVSVEPKSGRLVDVYKDVESLSLKLDLSGPTLQGLQSMISEMTAQKVFEYNVEQTDQSVKESIDGAKEDANSINLYKVYIPWALLIVGALILIIGLLIGGGGMPQEET